MKKNNGLLTTHQISQYCNVTVGTVINWVETGKLPAYKTPGGHRRVKRGEFLSFLKKYQMPLPEDFGKAEVNGNGKKVIILDDNSEVIGAIVNLCQKKNISYKMKNLEEE